ncbi:hypothetical protein Godav_029730 [Gossypium davidsonii]|uniref:Uncharacterized protein n=1 Tax=Gossypium davidsonii TaxID=34287 RepID=A0A7J8T8J9_GOSDV|nr:hypothetical protein [Gossypium davidsonii]
MSNCKAVWETVTECEWITFYLPPKEPTIIPVVQEFYLILKEREVMRPYYEMRTCVKVRGVDVLVTERSIFRFYDSLKKRMDLSARHKDPSNIISSTNDFNCKNLDEFRVMNLAYSRYLQYQPITGYSSVCNFAKEIDMHRYMDLSKYA